MIPTGNRTPIMPPSLISEWSTKFAYSYGYKCGNYVWISGQVARNGEGRIVEPANIEAQAVQVYENIKAVLEEAGGSLEHLVSNTTYITDRAYREVVTEVRHRYLPGPEYPANTLVIVDGLGVPEYLLEVEGVAILPE